jgi:tRNA (mo5U34)-methyltransferase
MPISQASSQRMIRFHNDSQSVSKLERTGMNAAELKTKALEFHDLLGDIRDQVDVDFNWYPYGTLNNFIHLEPILEKFPLETLILNSKRILDVGGADGDLAFFMESLGYQVDFVDNAPTNMNNLRAVRFTAKKLGSHVGIHDIDLDTQFSLPIDESIDLIFFLGILYHLKNPFYVLEQLAKSSRYLMLSTRVIQFLPDGRPVRNSTLAYLVSPSETNNDASNFWMFTVDGLKLICERAGWNVVSAHTVGDTLASNPRDQEHDERAFMLLQSKSQL